MNGHRMKTKPNNIIKSVQLNTVGDADIIAYMKNKAFSPTVKQLIREKMEKGE